MYELCSELMGLGTAKDTEATLTRAKAIIGTSQQIVKQLNGLIGRARLAKTLTSKRVHCEWK